jgi:hypothetical protein
VRLRVVLGVALLLVAGALALDMSGRAARTAGSNHTATPVFSASVPGGGVLCQSAPRITPAADRVRLLIGTYGRPVPALRMRFLAASGREVAEAQLAAGAREGVVTLPLIRQPGSATATSSCLRVGGSAGVVLGGESGPVATDSELVDGSPQPGRIGLLYLRAGRESWWQLLPVLNRRFGFGKASFVGDWALPVVVLLVLGIWAATARLLARELS